MTTIFLIKGARILDPVTQKDALGDLYIERGVFAPVPAILPPGAVVVEADGLVAVPGFVDLHVHLREPGHEAAETVESGCLAAARGGFTTIVAMPNTNPPLDTPAQVEALMQRAAAVNLGRVLPAPCITRARAGDEVADLVALGKAGAVAFTDDGCTVARDEVLEKAMREAGRLQIPVMDHALDSRLAAQGVMHEGKYSRALGLPGIPAEAETVIVARDIQLARATGCAMHIQHVSAAGSVELIRAARKEGLPVSGELTPHHLALTDACVEAARPECHKMNPPVRSEVDRAALVEGIVDGTLSCFATDHAPHTAATKAKGFLAAPFGVVGLETAVGVTYTLLVKKGLMSALDWVARWTVEPARILGRPAPSLAEGAPADLVLLDLKNEWVVNAAEFSSKSRNTPFDGWPLIGCAIKTFCAGRLIWSAPGLEAAATVLPGPRAKNIVLMGFMGTGKSTVGRALARQLGLQFLDMDTLIEERAGKPISRIFAEDGEPHFRAMERALSQELAQRRGLVIACGGGVVLNPDNIRDYGRTGLVVCLTATPEVIFKRTAKDRNRPLLEEEDRMRRILELLEKRKTLYASISHQVDTTALPADAVAAAIVALYG
jgi:dihydroorotase